MTNILRQAKLKLATMMQLKFASIETDKGTIYYDGDELVEGKEVYVMDGEGTYTLPEDGDYLYENKTFVVENGVIREIKEAAAKKPTGKKTAGKEKMAKKPGTPPANEQTGSVTPEAFNELVAVVENLVQEVDKLKNKTTSEKEEMEESFSRIKGEMGILKGSLSKVDASLKSALRMSTSAPIDNSKTIESKYKSNSRLNKFGIKL